MKNLIIRHCNDCPAFYLWPWPIKEKILVYCNHPEKQGEFILPGARDYAYNENNGKYLIYDKISIPDWCPIIV